jgi:hypothetical protein
MKFLILTLALSVSALSGIFCLPGCIEALENIIPEAKTITEREKTIQKPEKPNILRDLCREIH